MSYKRSRSTYEADDHAPYAKFGTPLPDEAESRDDGSFVPVWKQEVRDERGRKRLHGAFTGGWSAGYFNTVGSKEGWTPSTFVSSRSNRRKDDDSKNQQRAEDYMDEEDRADAAEAQKLQMTQAFAGLASANQQSSNAAGLMDLFRPTEDTIGLKLLRKMGWKDGQGIGPKVRRDARLDVAGPKAQQGQQTYLFAPEKMQMIHFNKKNDRKGLGYKGEAQLSRPDQGDERNDDDEDDDDGGLHFNRRSKPSIISSQRSRTKPERGGIGVGILNDNGSDEEDPYEIGPKIRYNRVIGADKKKKTKKSSASANPSLGNAPVFVPKIARAGGGLGRCHDGRLPLDGFSLAKVTEDLASLLLQYAPPTVPPGWTSSKNPGATDSNGQEYVSTADAARASKMDPKSRAAILGEKALPGKSIFDFISSSARDKIATASGKNLPPGLGEIPKEYALSEEEKYKMLWDQVSKIDRETAVAAIARGSAGPYADDESKRDRYRGYLEHQANPERPHPTKARHMSDDDFLREMNEFYNCARIFKPMTGFMASRFTTGKSSTSSTIRSSTVDTELLAKPEPKAEDPAEQAAKMGMFGSMTRSVTDFYPTRLLCKRFNVKPPPNARGDKEPNAASAAAAGGSTDNTEAWSRTMPSDPQTSTSTSSGAEKSSAPLALPSHLAQQTPAALEDKVELGRNEAVEGKTAQADVLKAIFGDSDSDDKIEKRAPPRTINNNDSGVDNSRRPPCAERKTAREPRNEAATLTGTEEPATGPSASTELIAEVLVQHAATSVADKVRAHGAAYDDARERVEDVKQQDTQDDDIEDAVLSRERYPPPQYPYPASEASSSTRPPPFSSLFAPPPNAAVERSGKRFSVPAPFAAAVEGEASSAPAYTAHQPEFQPEPWDPDQAAARAFHDPVAETKRALPQDTKGESSRRDEDAEPPPAYTEGDSPLQSFSFAMAAAGGASSIITQVQQGGPTVNAIGDVGADETIAMDLRGTRFVLSRDELLTLPEFVLLSLFPNGLFPEGHMGGMGEGDGVHVDYDPASLQYMLDFFRNVAQTIPSESSPGTSQDGDVVPIEPMGSRDDSSKRAGIIVLREDLDFYTIPPRADITAEEMLEVKRATARALLNQDGIFSGLKKSDEPGTTEAHLIEMLTAGGFNHDDQWGHRAGEPNKAVICSLALARLRSDIRGNEMGSNAVGMAQKLLLFWRKPARRCWWEGIELENVEGVEGKLKVWIRRVWTLEMSVIGLR